MKTGALIIGMSIGMAAGYAVYSLSNSSARDKRRIKSSAGKAFHAIGDMVDGISMLMK